MYCPLQVFSLGSGEFTASISNADISKTKNFFRILLGFNEIYVKFWVFWKKKDQSHSLSITEIIDCETGSYWNV